LQNTLQRTTGNSISVYKDVFSVPAAIDQFKRLKQAFPQLPAGFYDILLERIKEKGFTDQQLKDAINNLIDNFIYPVPTIANIVGFEKRIKLYTYQDITKLMDTDRDAFKNFAKVKKNGKLFWITKAEKEMYDVPDEI
jgi:hypothetical protein